MSDLSKVAEATARLIDALEAGIGDDDQVGAILLLAEVTTPGDGDDPEFSYVQWHCSDDRYLIQQGLVGWAHSSMTADHRRVADDEDGDDE